ncbi:hypothetical protein Droror1_Dr00001268 [Drosera rotundifolia]
MKESIWRSNLPENGWIFSPCHFPTPPPFSHLCPIVQRCCTWSSVSDHHTPSLLQRSPFQTHPDKKNTKSSKITKWVSQFWGKNLWVHRQIGDLMSDEGCVKKGV